MTKSGFLTWKNSSFSQIFKSTPQYGLFYSTYSWQKDQVDLPKPWVFAWIIEFSPLSFEGMFEDFKNSNIFASKFLHIPYCCERFILDFGILVVSPLFFGHFCWFLQQITPKFAESLSFLLEFWVFSMSFEVFYPWVFMAWSKKSLALGYSAWT